MKKLWNRIWNSEPVVLGGGLVTGWLALVAFDQGNDSFEIPTWAYAVAAPLTAIITYATRRNVTPTGK